MTFSLLRTLPVASGVTQGRCSTRSSGFCAAVLLGETFQSVTVPGKAPTTGTASGQTTAPSTASWSAPGPAEYGGAARLRHLVYRFHKRQGLPSRSGSKKGGCEALGRSRGGFSTKLHLVCDGLGNPLTAILTPGQQHESTVCTELLASVQIRTSAAGGRPRSRPKLVVADRGYDASAFRRYLCRRGIRCVIPRSVYLRVRVAGDAGVLLLSAGQPTSSAMWSSVWSGGSRNTGGPPHALRSWPVVSWRW